MSDLTPDAYGDIVGDPADPMLGWDVADFLRNPIALWSHDSRSPIGTWRDVSVANGALRGRLHLAPPGSTKLVDELRALLAANVVKGISVGFKPTESQPRGNGGVHYLRQTLVEASLVSVPANPAALLTAKALGVSKQTIEMIFKQSETSTIAQRIRRARSAIRKAKLLQQKADTPAKRASMARAIAHFEDEERELVASLSPRPKLKQDDQEQQDFMEQCISNLEDQGVDDAEDVCQILWEERAHAREVRARAMAQIREIDARRAREYAASPAGQKQQQEAENLAAFTRQAEKHRDPPKPVYDSSTPTWRGVKLPPLTWRGKKI